MKWSIEELLILLKGVVDLLSEVDEVLDVDPGLLEGEAEGWLPFDSEREQTGAAVGEDIIASISSTILLSSGSSSDVLDFAYSEHLSEEQYDIFFLSHA